MSNRYDDRDDDRSRRNYGRRSGRDYDSSYGQSSNRGFEDERDRYSGEDQWRGQSGGGRYSSRMGGSYQSSRENDGREDWQNERDTDRGRSYSGGYGSEYRTYGRGLGEMGQGYGNEWRSGGQGRYGGEGRYGEGGYSQRSNYPSGYRSGERYGERGGSSEYGRGEYGEGEERGWWDRASDAVASWFGDEEAERRRRMDEQRPHRGRGPKGYRRSDERIQEDVNDRLSEGYLDATDITVMVEGGEVTLTGTVNNRSDKRRAEDIAEYVSGVTNVENRLRVKNTNRYDTSMSTGASSTGTSDTSSSTGSTSGAARGKTAGSTSS